MLKRKTITRSRLCVRDNRSLQATMPQLVQRERNLIDKMVRRDGQKPSQAWKALKKARMARATKLGKRLKKPCGPSKKAVYNYVSGKTHRHYAKETRGRPEILTKGDVTKLIQVRRRLIVKAAGQKRVRYCDVVKVAKLGKRVSEKTVADKMRARGVKYRPARKKLYLTDKDAKVRVRVLKQWIKKPKRFWSDKVHGWMDNKKWVRKLTPKDRAKYNATKVTGHLRLPSEGQDRGFTRPRVDHTFLGLPAINICAMVAKGRIILWHDCGSKWNGEVATH